MGQQNQIPSNVPMRRQSTELRAPRERARARVLIKGKKRGFLTIHIIRLGFAHIPSESLFSFFLFFFLLFIPQY